MKSRCTFITGALMICVLVLIACNRNSGTKTTATTGEEPRAEVRVGDSVPDDWGHLDFKITAIYRNQTEIPEAPGHVDGGNWTFLDCVAKGRAGDAKFIVGMQQTPADGKDVAWGKATLRTADRKSGGAFMDIFATAFHAQLPPPQKENALRRVTFGTAILGDGMNRDGRGGGLSGKGAWTTTKWFPSADGLDAEVFFNYNLTTMQGEFSEKDPDYRDNLMDFWCNTLRDGSRGRRTPGQDATIVAAGPHLGESHSIAGAESRTVEFAPGGKWLLYSTHEDGKPAQLWTVECAAPANKKMLLETANYIYTFSAIDPEARQILVEQKLPQKSGVISSDDPSELWWIDQGSKEPRELNGPWNPHAVMIGTTAVSPDGRYVVASETKHNPQQKTSEENLYVVETATGTIASAQLPNEMLNPVGWQGTGAALRLKVLTGFSFDKSKPRRSYVVDPATGKLEPSSENFMDPLDSGTLSPDGALEARVIDKHRLDISPRNGGSKRVLEFSPEDRRFVDESCVAWVSPRYLIFSNPYLMFIDVQTMKMNYADDTDAVLTGVTFSPDFRYAAVQNEIGLSIRPVIFDMQR